jgi:hypothetical protein
MEEHKLDDPREVRGVGFNRAKDPVADSMISMDSLGELVKASQGSPAHPYVEHEPDAWTGGSFDATCQKLLSGDRSIVVKAEAMLGKLLDVTMQTPRREWNPSPVGAYPIVPEVLAGSPTPMRESRATQSELGPVGVYVNVSTSAGMDAEDIFKRGVVITALISKLQAVRPVDLYLMAANTREGHSGRNVVIVRLDTRPLDLSVVGFALSSVAVYRQIFIRLLWKISPRVTIGMPFPQEFKADLSGRTREFCGIGEQDIYIGMSYLDFKEMIKRPIEWVNGHLERLGG